MMTKAVLTKPLAVWCKLYLLRAKMVMMKRTEAVKSKKAGAVVLVRTVAGSFPWLAGPMMQVTVDLPLPDNPQNGRMSEKNSSNSTGAAYSPKAQPVADLSLPDYP